MDESTLSIPESQDVTKKHKHHRFDSKLPKSGNLESHYGKSKEYDILEREASLSRSDGSSSVDK
jgi:hypothetical protein